MKTLVFMFVAVLTIAYVTSANHNKRNGRRTARNEDSNPGAGTDVEWPSPETINDFTVPDEYTGGSGGDDGQEPGSGDESPPARHHGKNRHRSHRN